MKRMSGPEGTEAEHPELLQIDEIASPGRPGRRWLLVGMAVLSACGADEPASGGVQSATVSPDAPQAVAALDMVTRVVDLELGRDGRVWVLNSMEPYFVVIGPDGRVERQFGAEGGGPEEFNRPVALVRGPAPDEVWAYDVVRHTLIRISTEYRRELALPRDSLPLPSLVSFKGAGVNAAAPWLESGADGFLLARARVTHPESALHLWNADIVRIGEGGAEASIDLHMPVADLLGDPTSRYRGATILIPYPLWAACQDGTVGLDDPLSNTLRRFEDQVEVGSLGLPDERQTPMTADLVFEMFFRQFAGDRPSDQVPDMEEMRRLTQEQNEDFVRNSAPAFPEYSELRCASDGSFWLRRFDATTGRLGRGLEWLRVDVDGSHTLMTMPPTFTAFRIAPDRMWGIVQDSLGVESVAWIGLDGLR